MTCPKRVYSGSSDWHGHTCGRAAYQPEDGQPDNERGECKMHYNARHRIGKRYDAERKREAVRRRLIDESNALIEALGCGSLAYDHYGNPTGGVVLTADEATTVLAKLEA